MPDFYRPRDIPANHRFGAVFDTTSGAPAGVPIVRGETYYDDTTHIIYVAKLDLSGYDAYDFDFLLPLALSGLTDVDSTVTGIKGALIAGSGTGNPNQFTQLYFTDEGHVIVRKESEATGWEHRPFTIGGLLDVDVSTPPVNGQTLKYNSSSEMWEPADDLEGAGDPGVEIDIRNLDGGGAVTASVVEFPEYWVTDEGSGVVSIKPPVSRAYLFADCVDPSGGFIVWDNIPEDACDLFDIVTGDDTRATNGSGATRKYLMNLNWCVELIFAGAPGSPTLTYPSKIEVVKNASTVIYQWDIYTLCLAGESSMPPTSGSISGVVELADTEYIRIRYVGSGVDPTFLGGSTNNKRTWLEMILIDG